MHVAEDSLPLPQGAPHRFHENGIPASTQIWVTWPTSWRTREQRINPITDFARRWNAMNEDSGSKVPQPGKRTMLFRNLSDPLRERYWSLMSASTWSR